jgi:6-pyruvoyltetrahydropterin/6-carboxytetrahydropterin synthase
MTRASYEISIETTFSASHQLRDYKAPLEPLHGHNFRVEVFVATDADALPASGYVMDFLELEALLKEVVAPFDHRHLNDLAPFDALNPTTENMARFFFEELAKALPIGVSLRRVRVWEAPTYSATYGLGSGSGVE